MRVSYKLGLSYLIAIAVLFVLVNFWGKSKCTDRAEQNIKLQLRNVVTNLSDTSVAEYYEGEETIVRIRHELGTMEKVLNVRIWLVNAEHNVIADSSTQNDPAITKEDYDNSILEQNISENVVISPYFSEPMLVCSEPFMHNYRTAGFICLISLLM